MLLMVLVVLALLVLAITVTAWLVRQGTGASISSPREELDRRYASGELDRDDYLQRRRDLEG